MVSVEERAEALFVSDLQPSQHPSAVVVRHDVEWLLIVYGADGCAARVAEEFGDHPTAAAERMQWCRTTVEDAFSASSV